MVELEEDVAKDDSLGNVSLGNVDFFRLSLDLELSTTIRRIGTVTFGIMVRRFFGVNVGVSGSFGLIGVSVDFGQEGLNA